MDALQCQISDLEAENAQLRQLAEESRKEEETMATSSKPGMDTTTGDTGIHGMDDDVTIQQTIVDGLQQENSQLKLDLDAAVKQAQGTETEL